LGAGSTKPMPDVSSGAVAAVNQDNQDVADLAALGKTPSTQKTSAMLGGDSTPAKTTTPIGGSPGDATTVFPGGSSTFNEGSGQGAIPDVLASGDLSDNAKRVAESGGGRATAPGYAATATGPQYTAAGTKAGKDAQAAKTTTADPAVTKGSPAGAVPGGSVADISARLAELQKTMAPQKPSAFSNASIRDFAGGR